MDVAAKLIEQHRTLPKTPGVYLFLDPRKHPLYIGKSVNLKNRVGSYIRGNAKNLEDRIQRMVFEAHSLRFIETQTELLALLLEDALIKKYLPVYNVKQKQFRDYRYIRLTSDPHPRLETLADPHMVNTPIYGPFRDKFFIERLQQIFSRYLGFRPCQEANPTAVCIEYDLGQCLAPCIYPESKTNYSQSTQQVVQFLEGIDPGVIKTIEIEINESIQALRFEHAQRLREDLIFCDVFFNRQRFNHRFRIDYLRVKGRKPETPGYLFENGALKEVLLQKGRIWKVGEQLDLFELSIVLEDDPRFLLDRANLVYNWLQQNQGLMEYSFQSPAVSGAKWESSDK